MTFILSPVKGDGAMALNSHSSLLGEYDTRGVKFSPLLSVIEVMVSLHVRNPQSAMSIIASLLLVVVRDCTAQN